MYNCTYSDDRSYVAKLNVRYKGGLVEWSARTAESQRIVSLVLVWFTRVHKRAIDGWKTQSVNVV